LLVAWNRNLKSHDAWEKKKPLFFLWLNFSCREWSGGSGSDLHSPPCFHTVKKIGHLGIPEADATVARSGANEVLAVGSVEIDIAVPGVGILRVESFEPKDPCQDKILLSPRGRDVTCGDAAFENTPQGGPLANFLADPESSCGCPEAAFLSPDAEFGSGNVPGLDDGPVFKEINPLAAHIDNQKLV
jgi:hypothetical protein